MFRTTLSNLRAHKLRLLTTSFAVMLGVAFMAGTLVLTDTIGETFDGLFDEANAGTSAVVRSDSTISGERSAAQRARLDQSAVAQVATVPGVRRGLRPDRRRPRRAHG
jgi:putative ABC transport system permease protein